MAVRSVPFYDDSVFLGVFQSLTVGVLVTDRRGCIVYQNPEAERILEGGTNRLLPSEWVCRFGLFEADRITPLCPSRFPLVRAIGGEDVEPELIYMRAMGKEPRWLRISCRALARGTDRSGAVMVVNDVTRARRAVEDALMLSRALEQTADAVVVTDREGRIEYVNHAFESSTGYSRTEVIGSTPRLLKSGKHSQQFYEDLWSKLLTGEPFRGTLMNRKKSGELYWAEQTITPIKNEQGNITQFVSVLKDVTERRRKEEYEVQLRLARQVQHRFYDMEPKVSGFELAAAAKPADETGGDYLDFIPLPDGRVDICIGDVSGHGLDAALIMCLTRAYLRAFAQQTEDVGEVLMRVNRMLYADTEENRYVTLLMARLDRTRRMIRYASAGHVPGFIFSREGTLQSVLPSTGPPLGMFPDVPITSAQLPCSPGQTVLLVTDGILEASDNAEEQFGSDGIVRFMQSALQGSVHDLANGVCRAAQQFASGDMEQDDLTTIVARMTV